MTDPYQPSEIQRKLTQRLPDYGNLVEHIVGDTDGLLMCGYQQEIDHLQSRFNLQNKTIMEICTGIGICGVLMARDNQVHSYDISPKRIAYAEKNAALFDVEKNIKHYVQDVCEPGFTETVSYTPDFVFIDCDWRRDMHTDQLPHHSPDAFATCPRADNVYTLVRSAYQDATIVFKISAQADPTKFKELGPCEIITYQTGEKIKFYHVCFSDNIHPDRPIQL